jgi:uncharacterized protein (DUF58 family)
VTVKAVLDADDVRELDVLRRRFVVRARAGTSGEHASRRRGGTAEFEEHRPYAPGDDLRRLDWMAFARSGDPVMKTYRATEDVTVRVLVDASASLGAHGGEKLEDAARLAASIGYLALTAGERTQILRATGRGLHPGDAGRGRAAFARTLRDVEALEADGRVELAQAIDETCRRARRPGMLVVLSDFFDAGPIDTALSRAAHGGHDLALVQVLAEEDVSPTLAGDLTLTDAETGDAIDVTLDARALEAYFAQLARLTAALRSVARRHRGVFVQHTAGSPTLPTVRRFVLRSVD